MPDRDMARKLFTGAHVPASTVGQERKGEEEIKRLMTKLGHALADRDRADSAIRKLREALSRGEGSEERPGPEEEKELKELLKRLEETRDEVDELLARASSTLEKLRAISLWRRLAAVFGGILIFIGAMAITTGLFALFLGILSGIMAPEVAEVVGVVAIGLGALLVLSGFAHQLP